MKRRGHLQNNNSEKFNTGDAFWEMQCSSILVCKNK